MIITQIELLPHYSNRFFKRQFRTRKAANKDLLTKLERQLDNYFNKEKESLSISSLSISEVAYSLGFEHPQSFNKFFKSKTRFSLTEY